MAILVTGGAGFIGSHLSAALLKQGHDVFIWDAAPKHMTGKARYLDSLSGADDIALEAIFHLAAQADIGYSIKHPEESLSSDMQATVDAVTCAIKHRAKRFCFFSTSGVYCQSHSILNEASPVEAVTPYAACKLAGERLVSLLPHHGIGALSWRPQSVYGPRQRTGGYNKPLIPTAICAALRGKPIRLSGDGHFWRNFIYVDDVVRACLAFLETSVDLLRGEPVNLSDARAYDILEVAHTILRIVDTDMSSDAKDATRTCSDFVDPRVVLDAEHREWNPKSLVQSNTAFLKLWPDFWFTPLEDGLKATVAYYAQCATG